MKFIDDAIKESEERTEKKQSKRIATDIDDELMDIIEVSKAKILVIGSGGAGNNTVSRLNEIGIEGTETITVNTDAQDLFYSQAEKKILIGRKICSGLGAGGKPEVGELCAEESEDELKDQFESADMVFITCGLGGGTGTGSAPIIAKIARKAGALTVAIATMPFSAEGVKRRENAEEGLKKLKEAADTVIIIPNDKLLEVAPNLPLNKAFMVSDEILGRAVKGITDLITKPGLVALDFADIKSMMEGSGMAMIGMGESDSGDRALESVHEALNSPLLDLDVSDAKGALINISASSDLTLYEAEKIVQAIGDRIDPEAEIIWGTQIDESLQSTIRTTIVVSGVKSHKLYRSERFDDEPIPEFSDVKESSYDPLEEFLDGTFS